MCVVRYSTVRGEGHVGEEAESTIVAVVKYCGDPMHRAARVVIIEDEDEVRVELRREEQYAEWDEDEKLNRRPP